MRLLILSLFFLLSTSNSLQAQADSLTVVFFGVGPTGEKFKVYLAGKEVFYFKSSGKIEHEFKIPINRDQGYQMNLYVLRKGRFGLIYRDTFLNPYFDVTKKYFIIKRKFKLKNKYAIEFVWDNEIPRFID